MPSGTYIEPLTPCWREHSARGANRTGNYSYNLKKKKIARVASHNINHCKSIFFAKDKKAKKAKKQLLSEENTCWRGEAGRLRQLFFYS